MIAEWLSRRFWGSCNAPTPVQLLYMHPENKNGINHTHMVEVDNKFTAIPSYLPKSCNILLVNDISRGGHTLYSASNYLKERFPGGDVRSATLMCNKTSNKNPIIT
jgi:hypoxanthine phosphoribosyltransferase